MHGVSAASDLPHLKVCFHSISHIKVRRRLTVNTSEELAGRENSWHSRVSTCPCRLKDMKIRGKRKKVESWFTEKRTPIRSGKALKVIFPHKRPAGKHGN